MLTLSSILFFAAGLVIGYYTGHVKGYLDGHGESLELRHEEIEERYKEEHDLSITQLQRARRKALQALFDKVKVRK